MSPLAKRPRPAANHDPCIEARRRQRPASIAARCSARPRVRRRDGPGAGVATGAAAEPLEDDPWSLRAWASHAGVARAPSRFEKNVVRTLSNPNNEPRNSHARTPHHLLNGTITPNGLHFTIIHGGTAGHRSGAAQARHPRPGEAAAGVHARCAGALSDGVAHGVRRMRRQRAPMFSNEPMQANVQALHGLVSCAEWTGVLLSTLLEKPASIRRRNG